MDEGGGDEPSGYVHPFVAEKRLQMQARLEKRMRKLSRSNTEKLPLLTHDEDLSDDEDLGDAGAAGLPTEGGAPVSNISSLAESVK